MAKGVEKNLLEKVNIMYDTDLKFGDKFYLDNNHKRIYCIEEIRVVESVRLAVEGYDYQSGCCLFYPAEEEDYHALLFANKLTKLERKYRFKYTERFNECLPVFGKWFSNSDYIRYCPDSYVYISVGNGRSRLVSCSKDKALTLNDEAIKLNTFDILSMLELGLVEMELVEDE